MDNYTIKIAKGLANNADARLIRQQVFVEEQGFVNEFDDIDAKAYHAVIYTGGYPIATGRLFDRKWRSAHWTYLREKGISWQRFWQNDSGSP